VELHAMSVSDFMRGVTRVVGEDNRLN